MSLQVKWVGGSLPGVDRLAILVRGWWPTLAKVLKRAEQAWVVTFERDPRTGKPWRTKKAVREFVNSLLESQK